MTAWITDPKNGKKSATLTLLVYGYVVCLAKLLLSGVAVASLSCGEFSGVDFAAAIGALGALYGVRKHTDAKAASSQSADGTKPPVEGGEG